MDFAGSTAFFAGSPVAPTNYSISRLHLLHLSHPLMAIPLTPHGADNASDALHLYIHKPPAAGKDLDAMNVLEKDIRLWLQESVMCICFSDETHADLCFRTKGDGFIWLTLRHPRLPPSGSIDLYYTVPVADSNKTHLVLESAVPFIRYFRLASGMNRLLCTVEVHRVDEEETAELGDDLLSPYIRTGPNLLCGDYVEVVADRKTAYGLTVTNTTSKTLYVSGVV